MVHLPSAAAALTLSALSLFPARVLVSAEPISAPQPPPSSSHSLPNFAPRPEHARENAVHIFNAVHSAMRQWGSSVHHNGLGLIPATVPRGTLLYHGSRANTTPETFEWLAFELEHSESFARSWRKGKGTPAPEPPKPPGKGPGRGKPPGGPSGGRRPIVPAVDDESQRPLGAADGRDGREDLPDAVRGYFHTYRAKRDLKLLYLDGMAAGKTAMGTLDTQDILLRGVGKVPYFGEWERARDLCDVVTKWGLDGVVRMEIGFEVIYCDFFQGLDLVSVLKRPWNDQVEGKGEMNMFEWARAVGQRYDGIGGGRVRLDFAAMVSGLWYPLNVSNPNGRKDMPRLGNITEEGREVILGRMEEVINQTRWVDGKTDWQGVVDMIVTRYGDRIEALTDEESEGGDESFVSQVLVVTNSFVDYPRDASDSGFKGVRTAGREEEGYVKEARERCVSHHVAPVVVWRDEWTAEEGLIYEAVETVVRRICGELFDVRGMLLEAAPRLAAAFSEAEIRDIVGAAGGDDDDDDGVAGAVREGREVIKTLKRDLGWSLWRKCKPGCGVGEICFIAMWPFGLKEDHYHPSCQTRTSLESRDQSDPTDYYWDWEPRR
ncbi:hypothetical protein CCHL11_08556 [Colletotrichum chlorophyti]|uniref:Uncharacterized protein n=1 Tax=Colletotrichum chlorophyti TaxID=708187 RepID=A0A1Q8RAC1_9PEZI|nr:hypothetical protein CCHL11_08556 [Colletotrichum chlorophyti]